jgi:hypothetical protein
VHLLDGVRSKGDVVSWDIRRGRSSGAGDMKNNSALNPETADLVSAAFAKSWEFVRTDPELGHND